MFDVSRFIFALDSVLALFDGIFCLFFYVFFLFCSVLFRVALFWLVLCCLLGDSVVVDLMCSCLSKVDLDGVLVFIYEFVPCCDGIK